MQQILHFINMGVVLLGNIILLMTLFEYKYSLKTCVISFGIAWCATLTLSIVAFLTLGDETLSKIFMLLTALPICVVLFFITKQTLLRSLFSIFSEINFFFIVMGLNYVISNIFFDGARSSLILFTPIFYVAGIFCSIKFLRKPYLMVLNKLNNRILPLVLVAISITALFIYIAPGIIVPHDSYYNEILYGLIAVTAIVVYTVIFITMRYMLLDFEIEARETREKLLFLQLDSQQKLIEATKIHRHDLRHHNQLLFEYLINDDFDGAKKYLKDYTIRMDSEEVPVFCQNVAANVVISQYAAKAQQQMIWFECKADIPTDVFVENIDVCAILSNILENAVVSCQKAERERSIFLICKMDEGRLKINMKNTLAETLVFKDGVPVSTKGDSGGTGLLSVNTAVKKYNGMVYYTAHDSQFITQIILNA